MSEHAPGVQEVSIVADLAVSVDGVSATLTGSGQRLVLQTDAPHTFWAAVTQASLPAAVGRINPLQAIGRLADGLDSVGLELQIRGPGGPVVTLGTGSDSSLGRVLTGSRAVRFGTAREVATTVARRTQVSLSTHRGALAGFSGAVGVLAVTAIGLSRRGRGNSVGMGPN